MQELKQRFGDLINICHGSRGEERFLGNDDPGRFVELVRECLSHFTPWHTPCLVPAGVDPYDCRWRGDRRPAAGAASRGGDAGQRGGDCDEAAHDTNRADDRALESTFDELVRNLSLVPVVDDAYGELHCGVIIA